MNKVLFISLALLLVVSLGLAGCNGGGPYKLTMTVNPVGAGTATDLTGSSPYAAGTNVKIRAMAAGDYLFSHWSATAGTFFDPNVATTTFTMPAQAVTITAHFVGQLDHFTLYSTYTSYIEEAVSLEDEFLAVNATVESVAAFCNPADKCLGENVTPISNPDHHLTLCSISYDASPQTWCVEVDNQFGTQNLTVEGPYYLAVPTQKENHAPPAGLDHFLLYQVVEGESLDEVVDLNDQFANNPETEVYEPIFFANPVRKTHGQTVTEIKNADVKLVFYAVSITGDYFSTEVEVINQFGSRTLDMYGPVALAVPSEMLSATPPEPPGPAFAAVVGDYYHQLTNLLLANNISAVERDWDVIGDIGNYEVVVVNRLDDPGETTFLDFLDAASANGVGVVFTSSWSTNNPWGISLLEWHLGDPGGQSHAYYDGAVSYKVLEAHPIFDGWEVDDEITIITGGDYDHAWFWDYSGNVTAQVRTSYSGPKGDGVAVSTYGGSTHVLLASLGPQYYTSETSWTDDGRTIFINAVCFAAGI